MPLPITNPEWFTTWLLSWWCEWASIMSGNRESELFFLVLLFYAPPVLPIIFYILLLLFPFDFLPVLPINGIIDDELLRWISLVWLCYWADVLLFLLISCNKCLNRILYKYFVFIAYFFPLKKNGCLKQCSLLDLFVLWKSYMLSCLIKDEKLLCLKNLGRMVSENSFYFFTTKDSPSGDHATIESYFLS